MHNDASLNRREILKWTTPLVATVVLPVHAQTSSCFFLGNGIGEPPGAVVTTATCDSGVLIFRHRSESSGGIIERIELSNPNHILIQPAAFPVIAKDGGLFTFRIHDNTPGCNRDTGLSQGKMRIYSTNCPEPSIYQVEGDSVLRVI